MKGAIAPANEGTRAPAHPRTSAPAVSAPAANAPSANLKDALLAEIRRGKQLLYELAIAQARRIDVSDTQVVFTFAANQNVARGQLEQNRGWIEEATERVAGRRIPVSVVTDAAATTPEPAKAADTSKATEAKRDLKAEVQSSSAVQAMLEVFPAEISDVEEM